MGQPVGLVGQQVVGEQELGLAVEWERVAVDGLKTYSKKEFNSLINKELFLLSHASDQGA